MLISRGSSKGRSEVVLDYVYYKAGVPLATPSPIIYISMQLRHASSFGMVFHKNMYSMAQNTPLKQHPITDISGFLP